MTLGPGQEMTRNVKKWTKHAPKTDHFHRDSVFKMGLFFPDYPHGVSWSFWGQNAGSFFFMLGENEDPDQ